MRMRIKLTDPQWIARYGGQEVITLDGPHARAMIARGVAEELEERPKRKLPTVGRATSKRRARAERAEVTPK